MDFLAKLLHQAGSSKDAAKRDLGPTSALKGEDSFDKVSECSFTSAVSQLKTLDADTDTTAEYESASEQELSPSGSFITEGEETLISCGEHQTSLSFIANQLEKVHLSTPKVHVGKGFPFNFKEELDDSLTGFEGVESSKPPCDSSEHNSSSSTATTGRNDTVITVDEGFDLNIFSPRSVISSPPEESNILPILCLLDSSIASYTKVEEKEVQEQLEGPSEIACNAFETSSEDPITSEISVSNLNEARPINNECVSSLSSTSLHTLNTLSEISVNDQLIGKINSNTAIENATNGASLFSEEVVKDATSENSDSDILFTSSDTLKDNIVLINNTDDSILKTSNDTIKTVNVVLDNLSKSNLVDQLIVPYPETDSNNTSLGCESDNLNKKEEVSSLSVESLSLGEALSIVPEVPDLLRVVSEAESVTNQTKSSEESESAAPSTCSVEVSDQSLVAKPAMEEPVTGLPSDGCLLENEEPPSSLEGLSLDFPPVDLTQQGMMKTEVLQESNNSEAGPVTADEHFQAGEFVQQVEEFDFEVLSRKGLRKRPPSKLARESLFVNFDPLVSGEQNDFSMNESVEMASSGETPEVKTPPSKVQNDLLIPITPLGKSPTPVKAEQSLKPRPVSTPTPLRQEISKLQDLMVQQEQSYEAQISEQLSLLSAKEESIEQLKKQIRELSSQQPYQLKEKLKISEEEVTILRKENAALRKETTKIQSILDQYEKTISQLVTKSENEKSEFEKQKLLLIEERDSIAKHLANIEVAFNDVHLKYENSKTAIEKFKRNEELLQASIKDSSEKIELVQNRMKTLKDHATEKLNLANQEVAAMRKTHQAEMAKMKAIVKKSELTIQSLEGSIQQKQKEISELTVICDDLIGKTDGQ